jgi:ABC-type polysaccharide/polyol phosphate transport system ATPase subunit
MSTHFNSVLKKSNDFMLKDVNFSACQNDLVAVIGSVGAGKVIMKLDKIG